MFFSIIIPVLNEEKYLEKTLLSIKAQEYKNYEIIVVDNGSKDKSVEIAKKYTENIFFEERKGSSIYPMKKGYDNAKGDIFLACDADSVYDKNHLKRLNDLFEKNNEIKLIYGPFSFLENSRRKNLLLLYFYNFFNGFSRLFGVYLSGAANMSFRKDVYFEVGGYDVESNLASPDFRLTKKISKIGTVKYVSDLIVKTSNRRFENEKFSKKVRGTINTIILWCDIAFNINRIKNNFYYDKDYYDKHR